LAGAAVREGKADGAMGNKQSTRSRENIDPQLLKPTGLYPNCEWDERVLRRLILDRKLAPCHVGLEENSGEQEECPICMLNYPGGLNRSTCCKKPICTECFLQVCPRANKNASCPFCKAASYRVEFRGPLSLSERNRVQAEEQKAIELQIALQVREERAYRERLAAQGVDLEEDARRNERARSSADLSTSAPSASGAAMGSPASHASASPCHQSSSPRLAPPIGAEEGYERRWYQAQQQQGEMALMGSHAASPQIQNVEWHGSHSDEGRGWESELDDLMLMEAIRLSLNSGGAGAPVGAASGMEDRVTQLAEQVELSIRQQTRAAEAAPAPANPGHSRDTSPGMPAPMALPPAAVPMRTSGGALLSGGSQPSAADEAYDSPQSEDRSSSAPRREAWPDDAAPAPAGEPASVREDVLLISEGSEEGRSSRTSSGSREEARDASPQSESQLSDFESQLQLALALSLSMTPDEADAPSAAAEARAEAAEETAESGETSIPATSPETSDDELDTPQETEEEAEEVAHGEEEAAEAPAEEAAEAPAEEAVEAPPSA